jgi:hypothetical protein
MFAKYYIELKYGLFTLALLEGLVALNQTHTFSRLNSTVDSLFDLMSGLGFMGFFVVAVIGNAMLLAHIPYTMPLLSLALGGASLHHMWLMGVASGLGAAIGELFSYSITLKLLGGNPALENSALLRWIKRMVNTHPRLIPPLLLIYALTPLPDDTVIIPLAMVRYGLRQILPPLLVGKIAHNLGVATLFYFFTTWSANRVSANVQTDLALGLLLLFAMVILYQLEKARVEKRGSSTELTR